jgi:hypothetical protein
MKILKQRDQHENPNSREVIPTQDFRYHFGLSLNPYRKLEDLTLMMLYACRNIVFAV